MDPLSVGASIAGLLTTCVQIATLLQDFISAYSLAKEAQLEIHNFSIVLTKLTPLILGGVNTNIARTSMIDLDQVIITLTGSVCLFQELDREVKRLGTAGSTNLRVRLRWTLAHSSIGDLVRQLQNHKSTLMLILQILTCDSHDLAIENMHHLQKSVQQLIDMQVDKAMGTESDRNLSQGPFASVENSSTHRSIQTARTTDSMRSTRSRVENILSRTRLYRRALVNTSNFSVTGSTRPTIGWSALSGVSLSEVSVITVYELSISLGDLYNPAPYHSPNIDAASFLLASENGDVAEASLWLELGVNIESEGENRFRAMHFASENGHRDMVFMLIAGGADIRVHTSQGFTPLHLASFRGRTDIVQLLLDNKASVDIKTTSSPYYAWRNRVTIPAGDDVDSAQTALHLAASAGHVQSVSLLLTHGANIESRTAYHETSLHLASRGGYSDTVRLLLQEGVSVDSANRFSKRALDLAVSKGCVETVRILLGAGASADGRDRELYTPLHRAVLAGVPDIVHMLLDAGAMIDARHPSMGTAVHMSATASSQEIVEILIKRSPNIHAVAADGKIPLQIAISALQHGCARALLRDGALLAGHTSKLAVDLVDVLLNHDSSPTALTLKAIQRQIDIAWSKQNWETVETLRLYLSLGGGSGQSIESSDSILAGEIRNHYQPY